MTLLETYNRTLRVLNTNSTSYTQATFENDFNDSLALRVLDILRVRGYKNIQSKYAKADFVSTTGLSEGDDGYNGEYSFPTDLLDLYRIEVTFDGTDWHVLSSDNGRIYDVMESDVSEHDAQSIADNFNENDPHVVISRGGYKIRPLNTGDTQTNGIILHYAPRQATLTEDGDTPDFEANLHQILVYDCAEIESNAYPEKYSSRLPGILRKKQEVEEKFLNFYKTRLRPKAEIRVVKESFS